MSESIPSDAQQNAEHLQTIINVLDQLRTREPRRDPSESGSDTSSEADSNSAEKEWDALFALASAQRSLCESLQLLIEKQ